MGFLQAFPHMRSIGRDMKNHTSTTPVRPQTRGFTLPELLVVSGVIALLVGIIVAALSGAKQTANMAKAKTRLKDIATWMRDYSAENREYIVPSQFDYTASAANYAVKVRSDADLGAGQRYVGTWTDILWTQNGLGKNVINTIQAGNPDRYQFDSPDAELYRADEADWSPFRSSESNTHDFGGGNGVATPFGTGAQEGGYAGYFAANNFFNTDPNATWAATQPPQWYVTGQIKAPDKSMYIVDSVAGETINPDNAPNGPWDNPSYTFSADGGPATAATAAPNFEVDFRYNGMCLMLMLDGHSTAEAPWRDLDQLEGVSATATERIVRAKVRNLDQR